MIQSSILVVGATGTLGLLLVRQLAAAGIKPRALVRSREKAEAIASLATPVIGDLLAPETLAPAFRGVERVFVIGKPTPDMETLERNAIDAAAAAGARRIVYLSNFTAKEGSEQRPMHVHDLHERLASELEETGYIQIETDPKDARVRVLRLTEEGSKLMLDSLDVMAELEDRYASVIGDKRLTAILRGLSRAAASRAHRGPSRGRAASPRGAELRTSLARHEEGRAHQGLGATSAPAQVIRQCASPSPAVGSTRRRVRNAAARAA